MIKYEDCCNECGKKIYKIKKDSVLARHLGVCKKCMSFKIIITEEDWKYMCE